MFTALLVHSGQTLARCYERKRLVDFASFLSMLWGSLWCKRIAVLHLILDNGPTHASKQIESWIETQRLGFAVRIHWLPINASWLDQVEIVFSPLQRKALTPNHFRDREELRERVMNFFEERNRHPNPIRGSYTSADLQRHVAKSLPIAACSPVLRRQVRITPPFSTLKALESLVCSVALSVKAAVIS